MPKRKSTKRRRKGGLNRAIKKVLLEQTEIKRITHNFGASSTIAAAGFDLPMAVSIVGGTGSTQRVGHEIRLKSLYAELLLSAADVTNVVRLVFYTPKDAGDTLLADALTYYDTIDPDKYYVYKDILVTLSQTGSTYVKRLKVPLKINRKIRYDSSTGAPLSGEIHMYGVSDSAVVSHPLLHGSIKLWYTDF